MTASETQPGTAIAEAFDVQVSMRNYFSTYLLAAAAQQVEEVAAIENAHGPAAQPRFDLKQRGHVLGAILCATAFLEAMINELFQDAFDGYAPRDGATGSVSQATRDLMAEYWRATESGRGRPLEKYQALLRFSGKPLLDEGARLYQDASLAIQLRNAIAHYRSESVVAGDPHQMARRLQGKFPTNRLLTGAGNPWWPDHCLGAGCARWVLESVVRLADHVTVEISPRANYRVHRQTGWLGAVPGAPAVP